METINRDNILFIITKDEIQHEANNRFGRNLTIEETNTFKKMLEWGLLNDINVVYDSIFEEFAK
jgi:hypothetical protein